MDIRCETQDLRLILLNSSTLLVMKLQTVGGYRLGEKLGSGGMGVVYQGFDDRERPVAVKVLHPNIADDETARLRLAREVRTLQRISHPRIAAVIDADLEGEHPYIVTEFVSGTTLSKDVRSGGPFTESELVHFGHALIDALQAVHRAGVVHRDLKPANVMISDGEPVVIDFGIAQAADEVTVTVTGLVMGTPGYLSPEVVEGGDSDAATDWWGWGATMAYAATGRNPFGGGGIDAVIARVATGRADLSDCPERFVPVIRAALEPKPEDRPSAEELLGALVDIEEGRMPTLGLKREGANGAGETEVLPPGRQNPPRPASPPTAARTAVYPGGPPPPGGLPPRSGQPPRGPQSPRPAQASWSRPVHGSLEPRRGPALQPRPSPPQGAYPQSPGYPQAPGYQQPRPYPPANYPQQFPARVPAKRIRGGWPTFGAVMLGMAAAVFAPIVLVIVSYVWQVLARTIAKVHMAVRTRRFYEGPNGSRWAGLSSAPGAFLGSVFTSLSATILPVLGGLTIFILAHLNIVQFNGAPLPVTVELLAAAVIYTLILWTGPGSRRLRFGTRLTFDACTGSSRVAGAIIAVVLLLGAVLVLNSILLSDQYDLWPLPQDIVSAIPQIT